MKLIYIGTVIGFLIASEFWWAEDNTDDGDYWPIALIVIPLLSILWPCIFIGLGAVIVLEKLKIIGNATK